MPSRRELSKLAWSISTLPPVILCNPRDLELPLDIGVFWMRALDDAEIDPDTSLLVLVAGERSQEGKYATYLDAGRSVDAGVSDDLDVVLNGETYVALQRVVLWVDNLPAAGVSAAILRHELEHARQCLADPKALDVMNLAGEVVAYALEQSGVLYNRIPSEVSANAAGARFARNLFGDEAIDALLEDLPEFRALLAESWSAVPPDDGIVDAILEFIALFPEPV